MFRVGLALTFASLIGACGFQPLYGERAGGAQVLQEFRRVEIAPIADRVGQLVRNQLIDSVTPQGQPRSPVFVLTVTLERTKEGVAFQSDEQATRFNVSLEATFALRDVATGNVVAQGKTRSVAAFNIVRSEFANFTAESDALRRAARQIADSIALRIGVHFSTVQG